MVLSKKIKSIIKNNRIFYLWYVKRKYKEINFKAYVNKKLTFSPEATNISKTMKISNITSAAIFSCFSKNSLISNSQLFYLKELAKCVDAVILFFDNPILERELSKLDGVKNIVHMEFNRHSLYDFGSYRRGITFLKKHKLLNELEYLILCNDSCYGPIFDLNTIIANMNSKNNDFWGMIFDNDFIGHLQSWFICLKKKAINTNNFTKFFEKIRHQKYVWNIILKYETTFTEYMSKAGLTYDSYIPQHVCFNELERKTNIYGNLTMYPMELINHFNFPFIKKKCFTEYKQNNDETKQIMSYLKNKNKYIFQLITDEINN